MAQTFARQVADRFPLRLGTPQLKAVAALSAPENLTVTGSTLAPFLVPRVSGTEATRMCKNTSLILLQNLDGESNKTNSAIRRLLESNILIISLVTRIPLLYASLCWQHTLTQSTLRSLRFIGATDSSVPCAILVDIAKTINELLQEKIMSGDRLPRSKLSF
ncbi:hypothetical protein BASA83_003321 [Batrachochytrium salamandrivorans]|nr:hypothetical protein BASA83_003321 [Batrachochytrium salamandrivorans]